VWCCTPVLPVFLLRCIFTICLNCCTLYVLPASIWLFVSKFYLSHTRASYWEIIVTSVHDRQLIAYSTVGPLTVIIDIYCLLHCRSLVPYCSFRWLVIQLLVLHATISSTCCTLKLLYEGTWPRLQRACSSSDIIHAPVVAVIKELFIQNYW